MRKSRLRALCAEFAERFGRKPNGVEIRGMANDALAYIPSEKRRLKKAYLNIRSYNHK